VTIPEPVYKLANDPKIAKTQREIVRPFRKDGIDSLVFLDGKRIVDTVEKSQVDYFYVREIAEDLALSSQIIDAILTLRSPVFVPGEKWQFYYGETRFRCHSHAFAHPANDISMLETTVMKGRLDIGIGRGQPYIS